MNNCNRCQDTRLPLQERCVGGCCGAQLTAAPTILESVSSFLARLRLQPSCSRHAVLHAAVGQTARVLDSGYCDVITVVELSVSLVTKPSLGQR